jgi:hypothetical protein
MNASYQWSNKNYWENIAEEFSVDKQDAFNNLKFLALNDELEAAIKGLIIKEGYFQLNPLNLGLDIGSLAKLVKHLVSQNIPPPFAYIYDEFWILICTYTKVVEGILGPTFFRLPDFWVWHVDHKKEQSGWGPHRDKGYDSLRADGSPKSLTIWIPITESTPLNGCMYVVPADRDPTYGTINDKSSEFKHVDIRALPAKPGTLLCWNQAVMHWGAHSSNRATEPRISTAIEFQAGDIEPMNTPLMKPYEIPGFETRLKLIAKQIIQYKHMYPLSNEIEDWAVQTLSAKKLDADLNT